MFPELITVGQAADQLGLQSWRLGRFLRRGVAGVEVRRVGRESVIAAEQLPALQAALLAAGLLKKVEARATRCPA